MVPARVLARIATWRRLTEAGRVSRLREAIAYQSCIPADEVDIVVETNLPYRGSHGR